ncbi:rhodanese-like domain-containing protein [Chitinimonas taiwanensis]|uniref:Membrane protein DedA, SNARE-associated domain n=1 Tax=Chitinimonas taiwanensis DSM 18899 TaxID=1121279 RepID=A0A1K2HMA1_9NEIS|nr:VTT domain-containing protein [Chitinimonas taiwanensis]SFZ77821.1 membrane protein DedA, SNARE-associated domain [Chitinimonas taiwanensis DSM 18899]
MQPLIDLFDQHGPLLVFLNVFIEQLGAPIPAVPTLMLAGTLAAQGLLSAWSALILAVLGSGMANFIWYLAGRRHGHKVLGLMCRISLSPDTCVGRTTRAYTRWGVASLLIARFVPGLSALASPLAGALGLPAGRFVLFDTLGTSLWAGSAIGTGFLLHKQVDAILAALSAIGAVAIPVLLGLLALYVLYRWLERQRLLRFVRLHHMPVAALRERLQQGHAPIVVDVRSAASRASDPRRIPGALEMEVSEVQRLLADVPKDAEIVFYCSCPNEASAALAARALQRHGYRHVHPLAGGLDAWLAQQD